MSDTLAGALVIVAGIGMLWSARAYVETRRDSQKRARSEWERKHGRPPPRWAMIVWPMRERTELFIAYAVGVATIVGGVVVLV
jgi:hypothetical protein